MSQQEQRDSRLRTTEQREQARREHKLRSIAKAISWRVIASLTTTGLVYLFTGRLALAAGVGVLEAGLKMLFYYLHERAWQHISWGQPAHPLSILPVTRELDSEDMERIKKHLEELGYL